MGGVPEDSDVCGGLIVTMAFTYANGRVPESRLVTFATGWLPNEGTWKHQLPPATYRKHVALVALALANTGRTLKVSEGWGAYRPRHIQEYAKKIHGIYAATPGTSSHGMFWEGRQCAAIDYGNWSFVYGGDRAAFYRDVRSVGLVPGLISPHRGYPDEPWHVVDLDPWAAVPSGGGSAFVPEEDDMFTDDDRKKMSAVYDAIFRGGNSMKDNRASVSDSLARIARDAAAAADNTKPIIRASGKTSVRQELANVTARVSQLQASQAGLEAALQALAGAKGLDASAILKAAQQGVENALRKVTFTADVDG